MTVEKRLRDFHSSNGTCLDPIPDDTEVSERFVSEILKEPEGKPITLANISPSLASELEGPVFSYDPDEDLRSPEKEWPFGPTSSLGTVWPFIFVSSDYQDPGQSRSGRYFVCGVVAMFHAEPRKHALELPELTAAFGVLEDLLGFLPPGSSTSPLVASKFQFMLKSALPFGAPVETSAEVLSKIETTAMTVNDAMILDRTSAMSAQRLPAWKPFPLFHTNPHTLLKLHIVESVSFEVMNGELRLLTVVGRVFCDTDLPGSPEVVIPIDAALKPTAVLHDCAKFASDSSSERLKISCVPLSTPFELLSFSLPQTHPFPLDLSFRLFQISPQQFKFTLSAKLRIQFSQFSIVFCVNEGIKISNLPHLQQSTRTKAEVVNNSHIAWIFRNPSTFSPDGETLDGVVETDRPLAAGEEIAGSALVQFRIADAYFSKLRVVKESVSIFPSASKTQVTVSNETVSAGGCFVLNSATDVPSQTAVDLNDCVDLPQAA